MGQRVTLEQAVRLTGRSGKTLRAWLAEDPIPLSVILGHHRGGVRAKNGKVVKGQTRLIDVDELEQLNADRGGTWHAEHLPPASLDELSAEVARLRARVAVLEAGRKIPAPALPRTTPEQVVVPARVPVPVLSLDGNSSVLMAVRERVQVPLERPERQPRPEGTSVVTQLELAAHPLPPGWIPWSSWCKRHNVNPRAAEKIPKDPGVLRLPEPEALPKGQWWGSPRAQKNRTHWYEVNRSYREDQLPDVCRIAAEKWPDRFRLCDDLFCPCHEVSEA